MTVVLSGITRQALRRHRWTLAGPFVTQVVSATVIAAMVHTTYSVDHAPLSPEQRATPLVTNLVDAAAVFIGSAAYLAILVVAVTMSLAVSGQLRDIALLRTVGASPGQIRRSVAWQAVVVSVPASVLGWLLAFPVGAGWLAAMRQHAAAPGAVVFQPHPLALVIALSAGVPIAVVAAWLAAVRTSRLRPGTALTEVTTGRRRVGPARTVLGLVLLVGAVVLSAVLSRFAPEQADDASVVVMFAQCIGIGLLGPHLLRATRRLVLSGARRLDGDGGGLVRVALDDMAAMSRALSAALVPLVLATAFAIVKVAAHTTAQHVQGTADPAMDVWTDYSGTAVYCAFAGVAALTCFVTVLINRRQDLAAVRLVGATRGTVVAIMAVEAVIVSAVTVVVAAVVAAVTLAPMLWTSLGVWFPSVPMPVVAGGAVVVAVVVGAGMVGPAVALTRRPALRAADLAG